MSVQRSQLVSSVRLLCGEPPDRPLPEGLPTNLIFEELCNVEAEMLRDLDLSSKNSRVAKTETVLTAEQAEFPVGLSDFHAPSYVYLQPDSASEAWWPVEIVNHSSLLGMAGENRLAIAFSGSPATAYTSWIPDGSQTLRVWYERSSDDEPTMSGESEIGSLYDEYLKLQTAAQCKEYLKLELGDVLKARLVKSERQWQRYVNKGRQQGLGHKKRVFTPPRWGGRFPYVDRTRFFVS